MKTVEKYNFFVTYDSALGIVLIEKNSKNQLRPLLHRVSSMKLK